MSRAASLKGPLVETATRSVTPHPEDIALAGGMFGLFMMSWLASGTESMHWNSFTDAQSSVVRWTFTVVVALLITGSLAWRQSNQQLLAALMLAGATLHLLVFAGPNWMLLALPIAIYAIARWGSRRLALTALAIGSAWAVVASLVWLWPKSRHDARDFVLLFISCASVQLIGYLLARAVRTRAERADAEAVSAERAARADAARLRTEIARELHDVVAHSLSVMVVQAEGGKAVAVSDPAAASTALETIAIVGRESLGEMRHIVGLLRDDAACDDPFNGRPSPTLEDIPGMVAKAGDSVTLDIAGQTPIARPTVQAVAFRVVQESLTNVLKHAGAGAHAWVHVGYTPEGIEIDVRDDGGGRLQASDPPGHGIQGMRERAQSVGGRLVTEAAAEGGFRVQAWLPVSQEAA